MTRPVPDPEFDPGSADARLRRIEGQVTGVRRMLAAGRPCPDVLDQIAAVRASLRVVAEHVAAAAVRDCLERRTRAGDGGSDDETVAEVFAIIRRIDRWPS